MKMQKQNHKILTPLRKFLKRSNGNIAMMFGLTVVPFFGVVGLGMDGSRALMARYELQAALDAGTLAIGATVDDSVDKTVRLTDYVQKNFNVYGAGVPTVDAPDEVSQKNRINTTARVDMNTYFMGVLGYDKLTIEVSSQVAQETSGLMLSLVLDNTGSMSSRSGGETKIHSLRSATASLINILFDVEGSPTPSTVDDNPNLKVSIVPYVSTVNVGDEVKSFSANPDQNSYDQYQRGIKHKWKGCVVEHEDDLMYTDVDDNASASLDNIIGSTTQQNLVWQPYDWESSKGATYTRHFWWGTRRYYKRNNWKNNNINDAPETGNQQGPNLSCPTPITPLTSNYETLIDTTNPSKPTGMRWWPDGTLTDIGVAWGLRTLIPIRPFTESNDFKDDAGNSIWESEAWKKAIVIMTDGASNFNGTGNAAANGESYYSGYDRLNSPLFISHFGEKTGSSNQKWRSAVGDVDDRILSMCEKARAEGIQVYTVTFGSGASSGAIKQLYEDCAGSPDRAFHAPSEADLKNVFKAIARQLSNLRISK